MLMTKVWKEVKTKCLKVLLETKMNKIYPKQRNKTLLMNLPRKRLVKMRSK